MHRKLQVSLLLLSLILTTASLSCSSVASLPNPFASATPTATATSIPTATPSPTPSPTPTTTPLPTGMAIRDLPGGASRFFDYDGGYIINISADWLAVQLDPADITAAISKLGNTNPHLADAVKTLLDSTPGAFRIIAYDKQPAHSINGAIANFNVAMFQDRLSTSMPLGLLVKASMDQIRTQMPGVKIKQLPTKLNRQGISIGSAEIEWAFKMQNGSRMALYEKQLYFQTKDSLVVVTLSAPKTIASVVAPLFDELIDGIELMEP